eukprot:g2386.t1
MTTTKKIAGKKNNKNKKKRPIPRAHVHADGPRSARDSHKLPSMLELEESTEGAVRSMLRAMTSVVTVPYINLLHCATALRKMKGGDGIVDFFEQTFLDMLGDGHVTVTEKAVCEYIDMKRKLRRNEEGQRLLQHDADVCEESSQAGEKWAVRLFHEIDKNADGILNVREVLLALRHNDQLASALHLPTHIRQEDGSREAFEKIFQSMDADGLRHVTLEQFCDHFEKLRSREEPVRKSKPVTSPILHRLSSKTVTLEREARQQEESCIPQHGEDVKAFGTRLLRIRKEAIESMKSALAPRKADIASLWATKDLPSTICVALRVFLLITARSHELSRRHYHALVSGGTDAIGQATLAPQLRLPKRLREAKSALTNGVPLPIPSWRYGEIKAMCNQRVRLHPSRVPTDAKDVCIFARTVLLCIDAECQLQDFITKFWRQPVILGLNRIDSVMTGPESLLANRRGRSPRKQSYTALARPSSLEKASPVALSIKSTAERLLPVGRSKKEKKKEKKKATDIKSQPQVMADDSHAPMSHYYAISRTDSQAASLLQILKRLRACIHSKQTLFGRKICSAEDLFNAIDRNSDRVITIGEFEAATRRLDVGLTDDQVRALANWITVDRSGVITRRHFVKRMYVDPTGQSVALPNSHRVAVKKKSSATTQTGSGGDAIRIIPSYRTRLTENRLATSLRIILRQIRTMIHGGRRKLFGFQFRSAAELFVLLDARGQGEVLHDDFKRAMQRVDIGLTDTQIEILANHIDSSGLGYISRENFVRRIYIDPEVQHHHLHRRI